MPYKNVNKRVVFNLPKCTEYCLSKWQCEYKRYFINQMFSSVSKTYSYRHAYMMQNKKTAWYVFLNTV